VSLCQTFIPLLINDVFPVTPEGTYGSFSKTMKTIVWACPLEMLNYSDLLLQFCIRCLKIDPFRYSEIFRTLSDFLGVNSEHTTVQELLKTEFPIEFLKLSNLMAAKEENLSKFYEVIPDILSLISTLLLFCTTRMLGDESEFLQLIENLAKVYENFNNAETKTSILVFWSTCLTLELFYRNSEKLQLALQVMLSSPLALARNLPSLSMTHHLTKIYVTALLRPSSRRQQLQTPREMERERKVIEQAVLLGLKKIPGLSEKDKEIVGKRLLGSHDVRGVRETVTDIVHTLNT
jgi:hypothetical protein